MTRTGLTRRQMLKGGGIAVAGAGAGLAGYAWPQDAAAATIDIGTAPATPGDARGVLHFVSRPDLTPPALTIAHHGSTSSDPAYFILSPSGYPKTGPGTPGLMILDRAGRIVWYSPNLGFPASKGEGRVDLKVQSYRGQPVLTWWQGQVIAGHGEGNAVIADSSYRTIATVKAGHGLQADLHEFVISPQNTALITAYRPVTTNLSKVGGPAKGVAFSGVVQEIDIPTGKVLFEWDSLDHVPVTDTYVPHPGGTRAVPFDYLHINSIAIAPDGDLLLSARNTSAIYKVHRPSGKVAWTLGGKRSSFRMGPGTTFWFQHHITPLNASTVSLFDDGGSPPQKERQSRGILLDLDTRAMRATLKKSYTHPAALAAANQGSMQVLADGRVLVGWGNLPYFSEFAANGSLLLDGQFPVGDQSYRAFTVAARVNPAGGSVVYASWNGATEVDTWTVLSGTRASALAPAGSQRRSGFETTITVNTVGPFFAVSAQDRNGGQLGQSPTVEVEK
jgi:Arylsulfotransferase (ASST)